MSAAVAAIVTTGTAKYAVAGAVLLAVDSLVHALSLFVAELEEELLMKVPFEVYQSIFKETERAVPDKLVLV